MADERGGGGGLLPLVEEALPLSCVRFFGRGLADKQEKLANGVTGNTAKLKKNTLATWQRIWASFRISTADDIASTLDKVVAAKIVNPHDIVYIPIRSSGVGENMYNTAFWTPPSTMQRYGLKLAAYNEAPFVY